MSSGNTNVACIVVYDVSGGSLDPRFPIWRPRDVNMVDGRPFVALGERDHMLKGYLGVRNCHGFFLHIAKKRNARGGRVRNGIAFKCEEESA
jgi:hypothetical protein